MPKSKGPTNRRAILRSILAAGASAAVASSAARASSTPTAEADSALIALGAELEACDALKSACPDDDEERYEPLFERHWGLREKINGIPATTFNGLRVKASAAELSLKWGGDDVVDCPGCFSELCKSVCRDILSMAAT